MHVAQIIAEKGASVLTAGANDRITRLLKLLASRNVGAIVICDAAGAVIGIVSGGESAGAHLGGPSVRFRAATGDPVAAIRPHPPRANRSSRRRGRGGRIRHGRVLRPS